MNLTWNPGTVVFGGKDNFLAFCVFTGDGGRDFAFVHSKDNWNYAEAFTEMGDFIFFTFRISIVTLICRSMLSEMFGNVVGWTLFASLQNLSSCERVKLPDRLTRNEVLLEALGNKSQREGKCPISDLVWFEERVRKKNRSLQKRRRRKKCSREGPSCGAEGKESK
jgi:hypothetical protein